MTSFIVRLSLIAGLVLTFFTVSSAREVEGLVSVKRAGEVITVGGPDADIPGYTSKAIQIAVDAIKHRGGGTVRLNPGVYDIRGPVRLASNISLVGSGESTVLRKCDGVKTRFIVDADWGMLKIFVENPRGFEVGMGLQLYDDEFKDGWDVTTAVITAIDDNTLFLDNRTVHDYIAARNGTISNAISPVEAVEAENVRIADLKVDGNGDRNEYLNGCRGGGIYIHKSKNCLIENVHVTNYNGDSFSWQITENITVRNCEASYGRGLGFHPGTGSDGTVMTGCRSHHNAADGIFLCWRVQHGIFRDNVSYANGQYGISIGHQDTDNIFINNHVYENGSHGVYFREESEQNSGHRNIFRRNTVENNGTESAGVYGFYVGGKTRDIILENNTIRSTGKGSQVGAVFVGANAEKPAMRNNTITGHPELETQ